MVIVAELGVPAVTRSGRVSPKDTVRVSSSVSLSWLARSVATPSGWPASKVTDVSEA